MTSSDDEAEQNVLNEYVVGNPSSFSSGHRLHTTFKNYSKPFIEDSLSKNETYTRFKQFKKFNKYPMIRCYKKRELWEGDLIFFIDSLLIKHNDNFQYILAYIDVFTKNVFVSPIKNKKAETIKEETEIMFTKYGKPEKLRTDMGGEFNNSLFKLFLKKENVKLYFAIQDRKAAVIERFNLTIQSLLYKIMNEKNTLSWVECLPICLEIYRNRIHSTIKMSPSNAEKEENQQQIFSTMMSKYSIDSLRKMKKNNRPTKFKVGDFVRLFIKRTQYQRGYQSNVSIPYYRIFKIDRNLSKDRYYLEDTNYLKDNIPEKLEGAFLGNELVKYTPSDVFKLDPNHKITYKGSGRNKKAYVKWEGWSEKYNTWLPVTELKKLV